MTNKVKTADFMSPQIGASSLTSDGAIQEAERKHIILQLVRSHKDGVSTSDVAHGLNVANATAQKTLTELEREREVYSRSHTRRNILLWYPNGRLVHPYLEIFKELRGKTYRVTVQEGRSGAQVQLQERSFSLLSGERVEGAVFVDYNSLEDLIDMLQEIKKRYESVEMELNQV